MEALKEKLKRALEKLIVLLTKQVKILQQQLDNKKKRNEVKILDKNELVYQMAKSLLGQKLRTVRKELACAEVVNEVFIRATGSAVGGTTSTLRMHNVLIKEKKFRKVFEPVVGGLIISPSWKKIFWSTIKFGHVGIVGKNEVVYSNNSKTGLLDDHWTVDEWIKHWGKGGYLVEFYRLV